MRTSSSVVALTPRVYMRSAAARTIRSRVAKPRLVRRRACVSSYAARDMAATLGQEIPLTIHSGPSSPTLATDREGTGLISRSSRCRLSSCAEEIRSHGPVGRGAGDRRRDLEAEKNWAEQCLRMQLRCAAPPHSGLDG